MLPGLVSEVGELPVMLFLTRKSRVAVAEWFIYQSKLTVFLSSRVMVATWPDLEKKHTTICFATLFDHLNFTGGALLGKTHTAVCCFVLGSN